MGSSDKATAKGSLLGAWLPKEHTTRVALEFIQRSNLRSKMADEETQAGSPPVVVPNSIEQSLRGHFERILLISEVAAASLAEQVMGVFTEKEEQAQQLTGRCPSLLEATIEELIILLDAEPIGRRKSKSWQESSAMPLVHCSHHYRLLSIAHLCSSCVWVPQILTRPLGIDLVLGEDVEGGPLQGTQTAAGA